jgi:uncharacterized membrane protein YfcA
LIRRLFVVLFIAAFVAAAISGTVGFGGALLLLPVLIASVGSEQAVPLLTVAQFTGNFSRMAFGYRDIRWRAAARFLAAAIPCAVAGALCFVSVPGAVATRGIGLALLVFALLHGKRWLRFANNRSWLGFGGALVGFLSGLIGSAGPLGAAVFHAFDLPPVAYIATEATTALTLHAVKLLVYQRFIRFDAHFWWLALTLSAAMIAGTWASRRLVERVPAQRFRGFVTFLLGGIGLYMLVVGAH